MAYWEFLLQKEGDRDWLPLETAHVEISEGRYRIIAHTSYCETPVEIRLSQLLADQMPPRRRTLKRKGQTTENGLMVVIPFTHLTAGSWTVKCAVANPETIAPEARWEYGVQLQVLSIESDLDYWDADLEESAAAYLTPTDHPPAEATQPQIQPPVSEAAPQAEVAVPEKAAPVNVATTAAAPTAPVPTLLDAAPLEDLPLRLQLQHQALVAQQQASLLLQGQVTTFSQVEGLPTAGILWVQLRDPETGAVLHREPRSLAMAALPSRFDFPISLPANGTARLLVGEMSLWSATTPPQLLAIQGFTVTLNLDALLEDVANQGEEAAQPVFEETPAPAKPLSPPPAREIPFRRIYLPSTGLTLPPVIYRPLDTQTLDSPSLPAFSEQLPRRRAADAAPPLRPSKPLSLPPLGSSTRPRRDPQDRASSADPSIPAIELPALKRSPAPSSAPPEALPDLQPDPEEAPPQETETPPFQPDFQGRFWSRLSALAHEAQETAANLKAQMEAAGVDSGHDGPTLVPPDLPTPDPQPATTALDHEVVIYDSDLPANITPDATSRDFVTTPPVEVLPPGEADEALADIPVPQLSLPAGELIAGTPLPITVRLPLYARRLVVKVWVTDIQSRSLVDRPRWLMNWTPTDEGEQTALLQLQVPLGSLEAQFDAIAIDLTTQRESYKTTLVRAIVPPNLPDTDKADPI
ncbi:MAG: hypothetical protein F6J95_020985 [Leptolyngbya sp. SIO1E4]|nr:hypothetical protein [Leptolyngbya sp. SIO1E4]